MRESFSARCSKSGGMGSNRKITELGVSNPRVTGSPPKIFLPRYKPIMPNMGLVEICGQPLTSVFSMADHCFISSEIGGIFGRSRIARDLLFGGRTRFAFLVFITAFSDWHGLGAAGRKNKLRLRERLHLLEGGVGSEFAEEQALRRHVDDRKFGDDVVHDFDAGERQRALFQDFGLAVARGVLHGDEHALSSCD